jgi:hypothetical protein
MRKLRDYRAENARRHIGQAVQIARDQLGGGVSFYNMSNLLAIKRALGGKDAIPDNLSNLQLWHLSEIARLDPKLARRLSAKPHLITPAYKKYRAAIASLKKRRVSAEDRVNRAWPGLWQRWSEKFAPEDLPVMRKECARRILSELSPEDFHELMQEIC